MGARGHFVSSIDAKNHKVLVIWDLNGYGEYEFDWCICDKVMACTNIGGGGGATKNIIPPKFQISNFGDIITIAPSLGHVHRVTIFNYPGSIQPMLPIWRK